MLDFLYVVDGSRPYGPEYESEMEILRWTGQASMALINPIEGDDHIQSWQQALGQSLDYSYAHHIQRLMITGNFCLIAGIDPAQVDAWYLGVYLDAIEWVEMPNTRGMSQFADGGLIASKPYNASGNYINKMSDYCKHCHYDVKQKTTESACPRIVRGPRRPHAS